MRGLYSSRHARTCSADPRFEALELRLAARMACFKIAPKIGNVKYDEPGLVEPVWGSFGYVRCGGGVGISECLIAAYQCIRQL